MVGRALFGVVFLAMVVAAWTPRTHGAASAESASGATTGDGSSGIFSSTGHARRDAIEARGGSQGDVRDDDGASTDDRGQFSPEYYNGGGGRQLVLERAPDGHFYTDARIGNTTVHFLIDTGASNIALSRDAARAAGVAPSQSEFTGTASTANGTVALAPVTLDRVAIGPFEAHDVDAVVVDTPMDVSLLGQSWLRSVGTVTISGDRMILK